MRRSIQTFLAAAVLAWSALVQPREAVAQTVNLGTDWKAEGSDWYVDGGEQAPDYSLKLLLLGGDMQRSTRIGFRLAVDLP